MSESSWGSMEIYGNLTEEVALKLLAAIQEDISPEEFDTSGPCIYFMDPDLNGGESEYIKNYCVHYGLSYHTIYGACQGSYNGGQDFYDGKLHYHFPTNGDDEIVLGHIDMCALNEFLVMADEGEDLIAKYLVHNDKNNRVLNLYLKNASQDTEYTPLRAARQFVESCQGEGLIEKTISIGGRNEEDSKAWITENISNIREEHA